MSPGAHRGDDGSDDETFPSAPLPPRAPDELADEHDRSNAPTRVTRAPLDPAQQITAPESYPGGIELPPPVRSSPAMRRTQLDAPLRVAAVGPMALAVLFHVIIFAAAFLLPRLFDSSPHLRKPIIAKLVALGKARDQRLMPRLPEAPPPPPAAQGPVIAPQKPSAAVPAKSPKAPPSPRAHTPSTEELMERAMASASRNVDRERHQVKAEEREGSESGSAEGTATSSEEGDQYFAAVQAAILANYVLPSIISERERMSLKAIVDAWISSDGTIVKYVFEQRSGNRFFDDALELAIKRTKVPAPPGDRAASIRRDGVALVFTP